MSRTNSTSSETSQNNCIDLDNILLSNSGKLKILFILYTTE